MASHLRHKPGKMSDAFASLERFVRHEMRMSQPASK